MPEKIIWSPSAENDFARILEYLSANWNDKIANHFIKRVDTFLQLIANNPGLFPVIHKNPEIRKCVITRQNTLFYRKLPGAIEIIRIFDTRQDPEKLKFK